MITITKYIAFLHKKCGRFSGQQLNNYKDDLNIHQARDILNKLQLNCKYCQKKFKFKEKGKEIGVIHQWFNHNWDMIDFIKEKNSKENQGFKPGNQ